MKILIILLVIFSPSVFALEAVVTVLETPMLKEKDLNAPVVQYLRKGDVIKIYPGVQLNTDYDHLAPGPEKQKEIRKQIRHEQGEDPLFKGKPVDYVKGEDFIPTLDRQGHKVYVIASHLYVYYETEEEYSQTTPRKDPTDYRLQEPLPKNYPFNTPSGYRSQVLLGLMKPYPAIYPYVGSMGSRNQSLPVDVNITLLKRLESDLQDRTYYGVTLRTLYASSTYKFQDGARAEERFFRLGGGPYYSHDVFRGHNDVVNLYMAINFYLLNQLTVSQTTASGSDSRLYRAFAMAPRVGAQYHRKSVLENIDFVAGAAIDFEPPTRYTTAQGASQNAHWRKTGSDNFTTSTIINFGGYVGFQSAY
jgi:hypothetical protein